MTFPIHRMRRLRSTSAIRDLFQETKPQASDFILPLFVDESLKTPRAVDSMPGVFRHSLTSVVHEAQRAHTLGISAVLLFGIPKSKNAQATESYKKTGIVQKAVRALKKEIPALAVITDVCACEYTSHGHCGIIQKDDVANDSTLKLLQKIALSHAEAGADMVAPSDMMDGRVAAIREALDTNELTNTPILSYAAKFSSSYYGPFRDAADSTPAFGDRKTYQMSAANAREAMREIELDIAEGADAIMVKPALTALDIIAKAKERFTLPLWAYHVSGEYSMIKAAEKMNWLQKDVAMAESLLAMKRAGADRVITYWAKEAAQFFKEADLRYPLRLDNSKKRFLEAQKHLVGGVNSPVRAFKSVGGTPIFMARGKGAYVIDVDGNRYIDLVGSWGPLILGHVPLNVLNQVRRVLRKGFTFGAPSSLESDLAQQVKKAYPSIDKVRFVSSGTEATLSALRLARGATGKKRIIKFEGCYHGHGDSFLVSAGSGAATLGLPDSPGVPEEFAALTINLTYNDLKAVEEAFKRFNDIAGIIVEPVVGNMGVVPPKVGFLQGLRDLTQKHNALLIFDEVMTGFRVAHGGAQQLYGVKPDLTTLGKIIGGGMPVGAYGGRGDLMAQVAPEGPIYQAGTLSGNPVAMAAGLATLKELSEPKVYEELEEKAAYLEEGIRRAIQKMGVDAVYQRVGSMSTLFFCGHPVENYTQAKDANRQKYGKFFWAMAQRGVYLPPSQFEAFFLSTVLTQEHLKKIIRATQESLNETQLV